MRRKGIHREGLVIKILSNVVKITAKKVLLVTMLWGVPMLLNAQAPEGPMTPDPTVVPQKVPNIKVRTVLVNTPVTVRNPQGEMVHSLEATDFKITDNGVPQKITHFNMGGDPISLVVVVETSSRIGPILAQIRKTGILISQTVIGPTGEGAVVTFDDDVKTPLDFTNSADDLEKTMGSLQEGSGGSKLFDAMSKAVAMLSGRPEVSVTDYGKRRVMLVIGEAHDSGSEEKLGEVLRRAQLANITIYAVGVSGMKADLKRKPEEKPVPRATPDGVFGMPPPPGTVQTPTTDQQIAGGPVAAAVALAVWTVMHAKDKVTSHQLEIAAAATGGQHVSTWKSQALEKVIDEIGGELHSQYTITYTPSGSTADGYHEINVTVDRKDLTVRARPGYYLEPPPT
jgi:VWFA-related protein